MSNRILDDALLMQDQLRLWRRHLHAHPELSGREEQTAQFIAGELRKLGYDPIERVNGTHGVMAEIGPTGKDFVALRADIDALPITEETGVEYASQNPGAMHACGHDAHAAMLLGTAKLLQQHRERLTRPIRLIFQPHEELYPGGAPDMIAGGALKNVSSIFGIHISSTLPIGQLGTRPGPFMAATNPLSITITGKGGHAAMPNQCVDPIVAAAHVIVALQTVVSRNVPITEPAVVSVTQVSAGTADNIIPNDVHLRGTIRTFDAAARKLVCERVREIATGVAGSLGCKAEIHMDGGYPVLVNDKDAAARAFEAARQIGFDEKQLQTIAPMGGAEDFAYYCEKIPGVFVFLGAANDAKQCIYPHHHPKFNIDEDALAWGAALHTQYALSDQV